MGMANGWPVGGWKLQCQSGIPYTYVNLHPDGIFLVAYLSRDPEELQLTLQPLCTAFCLSHLQAILAELVIDQDGRITSWLRLCFTA